MVDFCKSMITWDPTFKDLSEIDQNDFALFHLLSAALEELANRVELNDGFNLIVRWKPEDIRSGVLI